MMIAAIVQARMGSTRLQGKILMDLCGRPVLWHVVSRVMKAESVNRLLVATSTNHEDDATVRYCKKSNIEVFRGPLEDVLTRYYLAANRLMEEGYDISHIVRITADCPLMDPVVINVVVEAAVKSNVDYASNTNPPTYPDGLDVEVIKYDALEKAFRDARSISDREHVTPYIRRTASFSKINLVNCVDLSEMRWTLDTPDDYIFMTQVFSRLGSEQSFGMQDVLNLLRRNPDLVTLNSGHKRNEGYVKSLLNDADCKR